MSNQKMIAAGAAIVGAMTIGWFATTTHGQARSSTVREASGTSRDLEGTWNFASVTPLERPKALAGKEVLTAEERAKLEEDYRTSRVDRPPRPGDVGAYNQFWFEWGTKTVETGRTSLIVDPPDGRMPPLTPAARERLQRLTGAANAPSDPEAFWPWERCLVGFNAGPPINGGEYNPHLQIIQTPEHVVLFTEMVHDARIVPLNSTPSVPSHLRQWLGVSQGRWDGNTLVVETANFRSESTGILYLQERGLGFTDENLRLTERFTRLDTDTLLYEYTVEDPTVWTRPWSVSMTMGRTDALIYEYACHEGNHSMSNVLSGARYADKQAASGGAVR
jgi:hypothetical protein